MAHGSIRPANPAEVAAINTGNEDDAGKQSELFALPALSLFPPPPGTAEAHCMVEAADSQFYIVKNDRGGERIMASEWMGTHLAEDSHIPCATPKVIGMFDGSELFGSRQIDGIADAAETTAILTSTSLGAQSNPIPGLQAWLSRLYAFDMFINNGDRHDENIISLDIAGTRRFFAIDFAQGFFWGEGIMGGFPGPTRHTRIMGREFRKRHGFDIAAANEVLDRLSGFDSGRVRGIINGMPSGWLSAPQRRSFLDWWGSNERLQKIEKLRLGLANGTLL